MSYKQLITNNEHGPVVQFFGTNQGIYRGQVYFDYRGVHVEPTNKFYWCGDLVDAIIALLTDWRKAHPNV